MFNATIEYIALKAKTRKFQQYFSYIVGVSFIGATNGAGNRRIWGKLPKLEQHTHTKPRG
jgi:hypothetical protein